MYSLLIKRVQGTIQANFPFLRRIETDQIEQLTRGISYAEVKYGEGQLKFIAQKS